MANTVILFSTKGGVGKSIIATNLAVVLGKEFGQKTLLVDMDLHVVGDIARMLDLKPQKTLVDLINLLKSGPIQDIFSTEVVTGGHLVGIDFLPGVLLPQQAPHLVAETIPKAFEILDKAYDFVIVDAGETFSDTFVACLNQANLILMVVTPDIHSVYQNKWALDILQFLQFPLSMLKIVLNRADSASSISWKEISTAFPVDIICRIPSEGRAVLHSVNRSIPLVIDNPRSKVAQVIKMFANELVKNKTLFVQRRQVDQLLLKNIILEKPQQFWETYGLSEVMPVVTKEELDEIVLLKKRIHARLIEELNLKRLDLKTFSDREKTKELRQRAEKMVANFLTEETGSFIASAEERKRITKEILDEVLGLGPLEDFLEDPSITDIMVNNKDEVYIERNGKIEPTNKRFISNEQVRVIIERIIAPIGRRIDESVPMVDARLPDGSRVNAIIPPLSLTGPTLTIRKFRKEKFTINDLLELKTLSQPMADFLRACVISRKNIIVSGGTGSGKTTNLNVLSSFIPDNERIITIEDAAELKLHQRHWIRLESRPPNVEGRGAITTRDLFRNTLRMRPDRIIIGECRGIETLDMLQAMNTGHDGSMTTIHANSTQDVLARMDSMILMSGIDLPIRAIREMIASAVHLIIHTARLSDGRRKIVQITELSGIKDELHIDMRDIFVFKQTGVDSAGNVLGYFTPTGHIPSFLADIKVRGIPISDSIFKVS
ncbi:MAG: Flp pilus assembly complex ATPase component TadA [Candidatus Omnitrophica bacterium]|nr:Flp pilus assembly complex ATPase component TadA [Candidatus Omnitrophota bacterium]